MVVYHITKNKLPGQNRGLVFFKKNHQVKAGG